MATFKRAIACHKTARVPPQCRHILQSTWCASPVYMSSFQVVASQPLLLFIQLGALTSTSHPTVMCTYTHVIDSWHTSSLLLSKDEHKYATRIVLEHVGLMWKSFVGSEVNAEEFVVKAIHVWLSLLVYEHTKATPAICNPGTTNNGFQSTPTTGSERTTKLFLELSSAGTCWPELH